MDLNQLDTIAVGEQGVPMQVKHPVSGEPLTKDDGTPQTITLAGHDSDRFRAAQRANTDRRLKSQRRVASAEEIDKENLELLVAVTLGWDIQVDGQTPEPSKAKIREIYTRFPWMREQVDVFVGDRANFLPSSATS